MHRSVTKLIQGVRQPLQEIAVVRHQYQRPRVLEQGIFQYILRIHVQMVRRLVKYQQVRRRKQQLGQRQPRFLSARKHLHFLLAVFAVEQETAQYISYLGPYVAHGNIIDGLEHGLLAVQHGRLVLGIVAQLHLCPQLEHSRIVFYLTHYDFCHCRLTLAVSSHKRHLAARSKQEVHIVKHLQFSVCLPQPLCLYHYLAAMGCRGKPEVDALGTHLVHFHRLHLLQHLDAALHLFALGGFVAEPLYKGLYLCHLSLLGRKLCHLRRPPLLHLHHILRIGAFIVIYTPCGNLDSSPCNVVQEGAVMRHQHHCPRIASQEILQPLYRLYIQVVGRLVQQQEIGLAQQQFGQLHTHLPSPAEFRHRPLKVVMLESQPQQHLLTSLPPAVGPQHRHLLRHFVVAVQQLGILGRLVVGSVGYLIGQLLL